MELSAFETDIKDTAYGGYGVGTMPDGRVIFVPHTVTGDRVLCRVVEDKKNFTYGELAEVIKKSPFRGESYCPHIGECGGCVFGHIKHEEQVNIKRDFVLTQLKRAKIEHPEPEIISADYREFRNRATFRIRDKKIGFFRFKSNDFIPVDGCPVIKKSIVDKAKAFAATTDGGSYVLYVTENENGEALAKTDADAASLCGFKGMLCASGVKGTDTIKFDTKYGHFFVGFDTFLQGNRHLSGLLQDFVHENGAGQLGVEMYCGAGYLTMALASVCKEVTAGEISRQSIALAKKAKIPNINWFAGRIEELIPLIRKKYDVVVVDPPRTGLEKPVAKYIKDSGAKKLIYISCSPDTLARDLNRLSGIYKVEKLKIIDMFPGSYHVECAVSLKLV